MSRRAEQDFGMFVGIVAVLVVVAAAIQSGLLPWAFLSGVAVFTAVFIYSREWQPASWAGGSVAALVTLIGILNVLAPGWHNLG